jgi:hypothetical protein
MNRLTALAVTLFIALLCSSVCLAQNGPGTPSATLNETEKEYLLFMREEEKLARDTYNTLYALWGESTFSTIAGSEQQHMDTLLSKLEFFGIEEEDPVLEPGMFTNPDLQALYDKLTTDGAVSLLEAFKAGAYFEETDIGDLQLAIDSTVKETLIKAYSNLQAASNNHLRAFVSHIDNLGVVYEAQVLDEEVVDEIVGDYNVVPGENFSINAGLNDAWFYPGTNGQGFFIAVYPDQETVFLAWFTFDTELPSEDALANLGSTGQRWLTAQGSFSGAQADLSITFTSGGMFDTGLPEPVMSDGGSILLQFDDCVSGSVTYDIPSIDRAGVVPIVRIVSDNVALCQELNALGQ